MRKGINKYRLAFNGVYLNQNFMKLIGLNYCYIYIKELYKYNKMLNKLNNDILQILITYLDYFIIHDIKFIKHKLLNLDLLCLKKTNKYMYDIIEEYYIKKYNYKTMYVIDNTITVHYKNIVNTVYFNEISKIGNIKMFNEISKYSYTQYCDIINNASDYGHLHILEWFKNSGFEFKYDKHAINVWAFYL